MSSALPRDALQPRTPDGLLPGAGLSLLVHAGLVVAIALGVRWQRTAAVEFSAELWSAVPEVAAPRAPAPQPAPQTAPARPAPAPPPPAATPSPTAADIALERERAASAAQSERVARLKKQREAEARRLQEAEAAALKRQRELQKQREEELAQKAEAERLERQRQDNLKRLRAQAGGGNGGAMSNGTAEQDTAPSQAYRDLLGGHVKSKLVMPDIDRLPPTLEAVVEVRATASGTVLSRRLIKPSGNSAWDNAVLRAVEAASPLPRDKDGLAKTLIVIKFKPAD